MNVIWAQQSQDKAWRNSIFLAGPTLRGPCDIKPWRLQALDELERLKFKGHVLVPEPVGCAPFTIDNAIDGYEPQVEWERTSLRTANVILFWIPRDLDKLPGFTTNIEFGEWASSGKCVLGYPEDAPKMKYLEYMAREYKIPTFNTLSETIAHATGRAW